MKIVPTKIEKKSWFSSDELIATVNNYFEETDFRDGIKALEHRLMKCIEVEGNHIENSTNIEKNLGFRQMMN